MAKKKVGDVVKKVKGKRKNTPVRAVGPPITPKKKGRFQVWVSGANFG